MIFLVNCILIDNFWVCLKGPFDNESFTLDSCDDAIILAILIIITRRIQSRSGCKALAYMLQVLRTRESDNLINNTVEPVLGTSVSF